MQNLLKSLNSKVCEKWELASKKLIKFCTVSVIFVILIIFSTSKLFAQSANHIVISRVVADGSTAEYVELYNPTPYDVDISGWTIRDITTVEATFPNGTILTAYHYISIGDSGANPDIVDSITLTDSGDNVNLFNGTSIVDDVSYGGDSTGTELPAAPGIPNPNDFIERKAMSTSTASSLASGGSHEFLGNGYDSNTNSVDFVYRNTGSYPAPKHLTDAEHIQITKNTNIPTTVFSNGDTNNTVMAINVREPDTNHTLKSFKLKWLGTMEYGIDFTNVYIWIDNGITPNLWDNNDTFLGKLNYNGTDSFTNNSFFPLNIYNTNFVITIDILLSARNAKTFKAIIPSNGVYCSSNGACYYSVTNANYQYVNIIVNPPNIISQGANPDIVALGNITLFTAVVTDAGDGIGNVWIDLSSIGGSSNQPLYDDGSNGDKVALDNIYSFSYTIPLTASKGPYTLPVYAESSNGAVKSSAYISLTIGENNPVIITEVGINNNLNGLDFMEIQNVSTNNVNLNGWAMGDLDGDDPAFVTSDATLRPGEVAIIYNGAGTSEDNSTGRGSNHYWDFYGAAGGFTGTKDEAVLANNNPIASGDVTYVVDALLYTTDGSASDDSTAVVNGGQWLPDATPENHVYSAVNTIFYRTVILDTDTKGDWADSAVPTPGATPFGYVFFDNTKYYGTNNTATIILGDSELSGASQIITIKSTTDTNGTTVTLYPNNSIWTGIVRFSTSASSTNTIRVSDGDTITAVYVDTNDHDGNPNNDTKTATAIWYATTPPTISSQQANPSLANNDGTESVLFTAKILDAGNGIGNVWIDLSSIGGNVTQTLYDDGSNGDITPGDNIYSFSYIIPTTSSKGPKSLLLYATSSNNSVTNSVKIDIVIGGIATHPVISEVATKLTNTGDQFVELYNPTSSPVDLTGWKLTKKTSTGTEDNLVTSFPAVSIPAYGYLLVVSPGYSTNTNIYPVKGDVVYSTGNTISSVGKNTVLLYDNTGTLIDKIGFLGSADYETSPYPQANPPQGGSFERKAKATSTATTMTDAGIDSAKGNGWDTDRNDQDFITRLVADPQNSSSLSETPGDKINITLSQISPSTNYPTYKNVTVMAFQLVNTSTSNIDTIKITNLGTMNATTDITNMSIWYDINNDKLWDTGDAPITSATYSGGYWTFTNLNAPSGTNFVVTIDIGPLVTHLSYFKGKIPVNGVVGVDGTVNKIAVQNNASQIALRAAPTINSLTTNIDNGTGAVTNNGSDTWDLVANITENSNSGIVAFADLSSIKAGTKVMTNYGGNIFALSNEVVPVTSPIGVKPIIVYAYDATTNLVTIKTTYITVTGNPPPAITNFNINYTNIVKNSRTNYYAFGTSTIVSQITFTVSATDDGKIISGGTIFTNKGSSYTQYMSLISGSSQKGVWQSILTNSLIDISIGAHTVTAYLNDNDGKIGITNRIINFIQNDIPTANAGSDKTVDGGTIVQLDGSGSSDVIGGIVQYQWSIDSTTVGSVDLSNPDIANPTFVAPNKNGYVKFKLIVTDLYQDSSTPSYVTIHINQVLPKTLDNAHPVNNPIVTSEQDRLEIRDLPPKTVVTIYTITGNKVDDIEVPEGQSWAEWQIPDYLAAGVYIVFMKDPDGNTKTMKIVVVR